MTNDRLAELLLPLQAVVKVDSPDDMPLLKKYAEILEARDKETVSPGVQLLASCKQIIENDKQVKDKEFIGTTVLIMKLVAREEEPWRHWSKGHEITPHALMHLLKPFGIRPEQSGDKKRRGYYKAHFQEPWKRYLP